MASGRLVPISISKTVFGPSPETPSTAMPMEVRSSASRRSSTGRSTNSRIHCGQSFIIFENELQIPHSYAVGNDIYSGLAHNVRRTTYDLRRTTVLPKLLQESHIPLKEQLQIIHSVHQHGNPVYAHAESEARNFLGIVAIVLHKFEDIGIDHATAKNFNPSRLLARTARAIIISALAASSADEAGDEHLGTWFSKREERRPEASLYVRAEQRLHGVVERALQIAEHDVRIHGQTLDLVKHGRVARIRRVVAMDIAGNHNSQRRLHLLHGANLHRRGMRSQQQLLALRFRTLISEKQRVLGVARRMVGREIQRL